MKTGRGWRFIAFGRPGAAGADIEAAAAAIGADTFIRALPDGYGTDVRKRGGRLSAGQRQLVAFARAFLADPAVLILDEATSSLDVPTERAVQRALRPLTVSPLRVQGQMLIFQVIDLSSWATEIGTPYSGWS